MNKIITWFQETFPAKEFMLRSNTGMKYFKLGTFMQVVLLTILVTSGCLVALFTYKMQFLQTVNYKQNLALKDLRVKYSKFTKAVIDLRDELNVENTNFTDTDLNVELQIRKVTKLLEMLEEDIGAISKNNDIKTDHRLMEIKTKLEDVINEKNDRQKILEELDQIIKSLKDNFDKIYNVSNDLFYIDYDFSSVRYIKNDPKEPISEKNFLDLKDSKKIYTNLFRTIDESLDAVTALKMFSYHIAMKKEEGQFYYNINNEVRLSTLATLKDRIEFLENIFKKTRSFNLAKLNQVSEEKNIGGPLLELGKDDIIANDIYEKSNYFETLRNRFLSVPLSGPMDKYYVTSAYGYRKDPYTKRRAFHKGIDLGAPWGTEIKSTAAGKVSFVGRYGSYGKSVFVDHGFGIETRYAHLSKIFVKEGQELLLGEALGKIGNTGRSTGKHLHYEIKIKNKARNPNAFLREGKNVHKNY
ncbi:MAG: peptidoglycan DD-metalloendopeptidase family protein [Pseudomonadota bacterium]|nr:peptidoglycan DD-metalloendopeptidase family protein [Pseudomonadota bacterium]